MVGGAGGGKTTGVADDYLRNVPTRENAIVCYNEPIAHLLKNSIFNEVYIERKFTILALYIMI